MSKYLIFFVYFFVQFVNSEENLGTVEVIGISPLPGIFIEKINILAPLKQ